MPIYSVTPLPNKIASCRLWWDFNDMSTINSGGTISDGAAVTAVRDKINGVVATGTGTYKTNFQNGKNLISFNGTSNAFQAANVSQVVGNVDRSVFVVSKILTINAFRYQLQLENVTANTDSFYSWFNSNSGGAFEYVEHDVVGTARFRYQTGNNDTTSFHMMGARVHGGLNVNKMGKLDNQTEFWQQGGNAVVIDPTSTNYLTIGGRSSTGGTISFVHSGYIGEVIYFDSFLNDRDFNAVRRYLQNKWGI